MIRLQPLRIPPGWEMVINKFLEIDVLNYSEDDDIWFDLTEDIMHIRKKSKKNTVGIDLGWYPDTDPLGQFHIKVILNENWEKPIEEFISRNQHEIVENIEELLIKYCSNSNIRAQSDLF